MKELKTEKVSLLMVCIFSLLMISFVFVQITVFELFDGSREDFYLHESRELENIMASKGVYVHLKDEFHSSYFDHPPSVSTRTLEYFYSLRAYDGAPPIIPHPIAGSETLTGDTCLGCHLHGGFTPKFQAYAPIVPHPEKINCRQCHNPQEEGGMFRALVWEETTARRGMAHLPGAPLVIPHPLSMRENCLSCHAGPHAVSEIRTTHPERVDCLQCHVVRQTEEVWVRR